MLISAVLIKSPFAILTTVVEVEHGSNRVDTKAVDMKFFYKHTGGGKQEIHNLYLAVVEYAGSPFLMLSATGIVVFEAAGSVETVKPVLILGKMCRYPVENNAYSRLMKKGSEKNVTYTLELPDTVAAPIAAGDVIGKIVYRCGDTVLDECDVTATESVDKISFWGLFARMLHIFTISA